MKKTNSFSYDKNIILDKSRMDMLYEILLKYCSSLSFETRLIDDSSIKFDSYNELMEYSNFKNGRIKRIEINGYSPHDKWDRNISITISSEKYNTDAFVCHYSFSNDKDEVMYKQEIQTVLEKSTAGHIKSRICSFVVYIFALVFAVWVAAKFFPEYLIGGCLVASLFAQVASSLFNNLILKKLFPMVSFSWGESVQYYDKINNWNDKIFWCIIVAIPVALIASFLFDLWKGVK